MINTKNSNVIIYMFFLSILNVLMIYLIKYDLNSIPIKNFSLDNLGNLAPLIIEWVFLILLFISLIVEKEFMATHRTFLFLFSTISLGLLLFGYLHFKFNIILIEDYLFGYPAQKVITGGSLLTGIFLHVFLGALIFNLFFNQRYVVYIRAILMSIFLFVVIFVSVFIFITVQEFNEFDIRPGSNNIAVVLGAAVWNHDQPSPIFKGRIEKANYLYRNKQIYKVQLCGGNAPGEISEAQAAFNYARKLGIKRYSMLIEEKTSTTNEQIKFIRNNLSSNPQFQNVLIISDQFHLARVMAMCNFFGVKAIGIQSDYHLNWEKLLYYRLRETIALINFWIFAI